MRGLTASERYAFDVAGYLVRRGALRGREVAALNAAVDALAVPPPGRTWTASASRVTSTARRAFVALLDHPAVFDVVVELCGRRLRLDHTYGIVMAPGTAGLGLHGGGTPFDPAQFYVVERRPHHCGLVAVAVVARRLRPGDGGFALRAREPQGGVPACPSRSPPELVGRGAPRAGDVVIFTEALTHGTLPWRAPLRAADAALQVLAGQLVAGARTRCCRRSWRRCSPNASGSCSSRPTSPTAGPLTGG